jgi:hypothetical protein
MFEIDIGQEVVDVGVAGLGAAGLVQDDEGFFPFAVVAQTTGVFDEDAGRGG